MKLAYRFYPAVRDNAAIAPSNTLVVAMHGFLGSNANWGSTAMYLSGKPVDAIPVGKKQISGSSVLAFDWRNHGDSFHSPEHNLDLHSSDIRELCKSVGNRANEDEEIQYIRSGVIDGPKAEPSAELSGSSDIKIVLMAHSMGGVCLQHHLVEHYNAAARREAAAKGEESSAEASVVAAVIVDSAPCERPPWFYELQSDLNSLRDLPLSQLRSRTEAERWLQHNGPPRLASNLWMIRYLLSNLENKPTILATAGAASGAEAEGAMSDSRAVVPVGQDAERGMQWKCNLDVLLDKMRGTEWQHVPPTDKDGLVDIPTLHVFGRKSPYRTEEALEAVGDYFGNSEIAMVDGAGHFPHMEQRPAFTRTVREFLDRVV